MLLVSTENGEELMADILIHVQHVIINYVHTPCCSTSTKTSQYQLEGYYRFTSHKFTCNI
jgi:hypothetical protein